MKKIYLLISSITLGSLAFGQASKLSTDGLKSTNLSRQTLSTEKNIVTPAKAKEKAAGKKGGKEAGTSQSSQVAKSNNQNAEKSTLGDLDALVALKEKMNKG